MGNNPTYLLKQAGITVSLFCLLLFASCGSNDHVVAEVDGNQLTEKSAELMMQHLGYDIKSNKDWKVFVENWCEQEVLKTELKNTDPDKAKLVEMRSQAFIGELSHFYLEELQISNTMDSIVSEPELLSYYEKHKEDFSLQDYIVQALYIKIPKEAKILPQLKTLYLLKKDKDLSQVNSYAKLYAEDFYFDDQQWIYFNELTKDIPLKKYNKDNIVLNRTKTYIEDDNYVYFINIIDYKLKDATPPFDFLKEQIREIIIARRINTLRNQNEEKFIQKIKNKHEIEIHL